MSIKNRSKKIILITLALIICGVVVFFEGPSFSKIINNEVEYNSIAENNFLEDKNNNLEKEKTEIKEEEKKEEVLPAPITHIETPGVVKAIYLSGWVAGTKSIRDRLIKIIDDTELNAVVIDIKDSTGRISFEIDDPLIKEIGSPENRIANIRELTNLLHTKGVYIIGRISVFQDPFLSKLKPDWSIKRLSDGGVWKDKKGLSFLNPMNEKVREYTLAIAIGSYNLGFDEINFDYIRYPSDGNMKDIDYNLKEGETRADNIENFFIYLSKKIKEVENIPISGDLFGLTTETLDDMGIGQVWEKAIPYFDFLCPMVYPSHYPSGYNGYKNPALYPYEVINKSIKSAIVKTEAVGQSVNKIRPWLQDFDLGAVYTKELVKEQIKATYDLGLSSWMLWDPSNKYTPDALELEIVKNN
jgi:hypothetical protein